MPDAEAFVVAVVVVAWQNVQWFRTDLKALSVPNKIALLTFVSVLAEFFKSQRRRERDG